ncbi:hypothetical protein CAPN004_10780 [Capnocytophaga cynodegmi]|uniref:tape measure protein n=1 Tax=Capnocytophaga cynodegmi TaxID=28189 RepID=UPI001AC34254|nr:tape measure protein [Capnocytophaga cynodegmi]GIM52048.1 hypothetical protein CAPN004_10780 [Capnocytophaga cynodegmi]
MNNREGSIWYSLGLDNASLQRDANQAKDIIKNIGDNVVAEGKRIDSVYNNISRNLAFVFTTSAAGALANQIIRVRSEFQQLEISFTTMLKSRAKAESLMSEMVELAAKTPFGLQEISEGAKRLLAFQVPAEEVTDTLRRMGDVAAGLGVPMGQLIHVYGQVKAQGRLMTNDLYQFMNAGIPIIAELSKITGKAQAEVKEMVSQGKIGFAEIQQVFKGMTDSGGLFHNMNEELSKSLKGQISNLRDNIESMFNELGKSSEGFFSGAVSGINFLVENYKTIGKTLSVLVATYGTYKTALMAQAVAQQVVTRYGQYDVVTKQLQTRATIQAMLAQVKLNTAVLANPYVLAGAALAGLVVAVWQFSDSMTESEKAQKRFNEEQKRQADLIQKEREEVDKLLSVVKDETKSKGERILSFQKLQSLYPDIFSKYKTEEELLRNINEVEKERNNLIKSRELEADKDYVNRLKKDIETLKIKRANSSSLSDISYYKKEIEAKEEELKKASEKQRWKDVLDRESKIAEQSVKDKLKTYDLLIEEYNRRHNKKINSNQNIGAERDIRKTKFAPFEATGYEDLTDADLGYLIAKTKKLNEAEEARNKSIDNRIQLQKEVAELEKKINSIQSQNSQSQTDKDNLKKWKEEKEQKEKILQNDYGQKKEQYSKKADKSEFDYEKHRKELARKEQDNLFIQEEARISIMEEGFEKRQALLQLEYDKREEEIRRRSDDELARFIEIERQKAEAEGRWKKGQSFNTDTPEINAEIAKQQAIQDVLLKSNLENFERQQKTLFDDLLKKYQTYEEKRADIAKEFDKEITELQKKNIDGIYDKNIAEVKRKKSEALLQLEISSSDANTAISNLFGDMSKKSIEDLEALQQAGEEAFEKLKVSGTLGIEALKAIEDKLKNNKQLIRSLSPIFKQLSADFKILGKKNASAEEKENAFNGITENIQKSTQALSQFGDVLNSLGDDSLSRIANTLSEITSRATGVASTLKNLGVGGGLSLGIGAGIGVLTSVFNYFSQARQQRDEAERRRRELEIEHQKKLADLEHQRILQMERFSNVFVQNKMGRHIEQLNEYKKGVNKFGNELRSLQNMEVWDRTEKVEEWFPDWFTIYREYDKDFFKPFKEKYGELIDDFGNINYKLLEKLNPNSREFQGGFKDGLFGNYTKGYSEFVEKLQDAQAKLKEVRAKLDEYVNETFGELGNNFANNIITSVQKGTNAFDSFGSTASNVMKNLINQMLVTNKVKKMFDDFNKSIGDIYAQNLGVDNAVVFEKVKDKTIDFVNRVLKPEIEKGEALTKNIFDELEKQGVKMYDEQSRQAQAKGFASMTQDQASELNAKFTLGIELDRVRNIHLENITKSIAESYKFLQEVSDKQLKHLSGIEANTNVLHQMSKDMNSMKQSFDEIKLHGIKMK